MSLNLSNSTCYHANDASQGFSIWTEEKPGTTVSWNFVLPNMIATVPDSNGVCFEIAIKLTPGMLISWDGRLIRHGTSVINCCGNSLVHSLWSSMACLIHRGRRVQGTRTVDGYTSIMFPFFLRTQTDVNCRMLFPSISVQSSQIKCGVSFPFNQRSCITWPCNQVSTPLNQLKFHVAVVRRWTNLHVLWILRSVCAGGS